MRYKVIFIFDPSRFKSKFPFESLQNRFQTHPLRNQLCQFSFIFVLKYEIFNTERFEGGSLFTLHLERNENFMRIRVNENFNSLKKEEIEYDFYFDGSSKLSEKVINLSICTEITYFSPFIVQPEIPSGPFENSFLVKRQKTFSLVWSPFII